MPHQCTNCEYLFEDGSKEMLSGCPDCGGNKFQFRPQNWSPTESTATQLDTASTDGSESMSGSDKDDGAERTTPEDAGDIIDASEHTESPAQRSARTDTVSPSDMPNVSAWPDETDSSDTQTETRSGGSSDVVPEDPYERKAWEETQKSKMGMEELRQELNEQFESIKILEPGEYELNLMELYEREEYIIALQEDGRYMIEVPNYWDEDE